MSSLSTKNAALFALTVAVYLKKKRKVGKRKWVKQWLLKRDTLSHINLMKELSSEPSDWLNYMRMDEETYNWLLSKVSPIIQKSDTVMRKAITPHERLSATLRYLATGRSYEDLKFSVAISPQALGKIIPETCKAIIEVLSEEYLKFPQTANDWMEIARGFEEAWNFPNCLGAVDGKHVMIVPPANQGSYYYNYKGTHSIVLMAIANANYEFVLCDVGTNGRVSNGGVIDNTVFYENLKAGTLNLPPPRLVDGCDTPLPYTYVGDEAFSLMDTFQKPFSQRQLTIERRIYNYCLSRARRIVENAFGILVARFRIFHAAINLQVENIAIVVMACCSLHNLLRRTRPAAYTPAPNLDQENYDEAVINLGLRPDGPSFFDLQCGHNRNTGDQAKQVRELFVQYFNGVGKVPWQEKMVGLA